jgi:glycosyltransferase involved in cell wall biosynthesis
LSIPRITVGLPVYKGADLVAKALDCLQQQTYGNFEAIISVDNSDTETAIVCRPFLADPRFRMIVHPNRLDWVGNFNWLLHQDLKEFFCYRQHDDTSAPEFFEVLLRTADQRRNAAAVYCDCQYYGISKGIEIAPSIEGEPLDRMLQYVERIQATAVRGLIRSAAIRQAGPLRSDEFRAPHQIYSWLAKVLRWGSFKRVSKPLYYRLDHTRRYTNEFFDGPDNRKRAAWSTIFSGLLEAVTPLCRTPEEQLFFQKAILYQLVTNPMMRPNNETYSSKKLIAECLERLRYEGNGSLFNEEKLAPFIKQLQGLPESFTSSRTRRAVYKIRQRSCLGRIIHPRSGMQRAIYQFRFLFGLSEKVSKLIFRKVLRLLFAK